MSIETEMLNLTHIDRSMLAEVSPSHWEKMLSCIQCGTCTASCPAAHMMDIPPRRMWRMVQLGLVEKVLRSKSIWLCSACYSCHVRCPRGIPLTETMNRLKQLALQRGLVSSGTSQAFYRSFATLIRRYGRMREMELMARYVLSNPLAGVRFAPLGWKMLWRGKLQVQLPRLAGQDRLGRLFDRVAELEQQTPDSPNR